MRARGSRFPAAGLVTLLFVLAACGPDPELRPDQRLQDELGLTSRDEVHRISISGGRVESASPEVVTIPADAYVEFVTVDSWVHEVYFEVDSLEAAARDFLESSDQVGSPPMVTPDSRFVVSMHGAPPGRYPFRVDGNGESTRGAIVVEEDGRR